jgi:hypothetical protein
VSTVYHIKAHTYTFSDTGERNITSEAIKLWGKGAAQNISDDELLDELDDFDLGPLREKRMEELRQEYASNSGRVPVLNGTEWTS